VNRKNFDAIDLCDALLENNNRVTAARVAARIPDHHEPKP
jgi:hypothetical protein